MAEEIIYQFNALLADNTVTVDDKEDKILVPVSNGNADTARIIENSQWNPAKNSITVNFQMGAVADR